MGLFGYDISAFLNDCYSAPAVPNDVCNTWNVFDGWTLGVALAIDASLVHTKNAVYGVCFEYLDSCTLIYSSASKVNYYYSNIQYSSVAITSSKPNFAQATT